MTMIEMANEVCGGRRVDGGRKGMDWWNKKLKQKRKEKSEET